MIKLKTHSRGFTIVELLVVIVVIAILASITIVAYNGIQTRAQNAKTFSAVQTYLKGLAIFKGTDGNDGNYPDSGNISGLGWYNCLGESYPADKCWDSSGSYIENTPLNTTLKDALGSNLPMPGTYSPGISGIVYVPSDGQPVGGFWNVDGKPTNWLLYNVQGSTTKCGVGPVATHTSTTFISTPPASGQTIPGANPACWIPLTN